MYSWQAAPSSQAGKCVYPEHPNLYPSAFSAVAACAGAAFVCFHKPAYSLHNDGKQREALEQSGQVEPVSMDFA